MLASNIMLDFMAYFVPGYNVTASVKGRACTSYCTVQARRRLLVSELEEAGNCEARHKRDIDHKSNT